MRRTAGGLAILALLLLAAAFLTACDGRPKPVITDAQANREIILQLEKSREELRASGQCWGCL